MRLKTVVNYLEDLVSDHPRVTGSLLAVSLVVNVIQYVIR